MEFLTPRQQKIRKQREAICTTYKQYIAEAKQHEERVSMYSILCKIADKYDRTPFGVRYILTECGIFQKNI